MKSYSDKTPPDSMKAMKPDTTAPEDDGDLDNDDLSDGEGGTSGFIDKGLGLVSENDDHFNAPSESSLSTERTAESVSLDWLVDDLRDACLTKRAKNNNRERERKEKIKNDMMELKSLLPSEMQSDKKQTHHDLLQLAISFMRSLLYQSNSLKLNQITSNQNSQSSDSQTQKELEDLRSELAKYKLLFNNAGLPQGIDLSQILINWRFKTPEELLCNPGISLDVNLPMYQQQQQQQQQQQFFTQQQQPQQQFNQFQSQGIFQNLTGNQQTLAQFTAVTNQGHQLQPASQQMQQQVAFNHNLQQISFAQQSFSLTQHTELQQQQQQHQQQQHQFQQQLGYVQQNIQTTFELDGLATASAVEGSTPASDSATPAVAHVGSMSNQNTTQDFLRSNESQDFATSTALELTHNDSISMNSANNISNHSGSTVTGEHESINDSNTLNVKENIPSTNEMLDEGSANCAANNDNVSTSFSGKQTGTSGNSLTDLLSGEEMCTDEMVAAASSSSTFMPFESSTTDSNFQQQQQQHQGVTSFEEGHLKSSNSLGPEGGSYMSDCNRMDSFGNAPNVAQLQQTQQNIIGHQQFHFGSNGELMADSCGASMSTPSGNHNDPNSQQQTMQSSLILQNGQLILVNNNNCNAINNSANMNQQQMQQNFFMQPQQQNVLTQQSGFMGQAGNLTIQTDHNQLLAQQQGSTQFIGPNGSINFLTGHGLQTNIAAGGSVFQNPVGIINPMNVLGGAVPQNYNQTLSMNTPQGQMMMPAKANDQPQALLLPDGQIIPVVTQPNLLFPSQQCIPVTGSLLVPSVGASQGRACPLPNILSTKPQPTALIGSSKSKKRQQTATMVAPPSNLQNVTLPPSMTAVLTPEGNVILSFPASSACQTQVENKPNSSNAGMKSTQRPLMPKPASVVQHHSNLFETKMFAQPQAPFYQNVLNLQQGMSQPLSMMPLVQHQSSQFIQPVPNLSNASNEMHDLSNRGIECISPAITHSGEAFLQTPNAILSASNQLSCNPPLFHQVTSLNQSCYSVSNQNCYSASNANEVTTSTGNVEPTATGEVKKKPKKKKKKKILAVSDNQISANNPIQEVFKDNVGNGILLKTGTDFNQEKEVDITDFSDLIRMEPMTPRPPDTSGRLTPPSQPFRTPVMNTPIMTSQSITNQVQSADNFDDILGLDNSKPTSQHLLIKSESSSIPVSCALGDFSSCSFSDNLLVTSPPKGLLPGIPPSAMTHSFSTVSLSPSLTSIPSSAAPTLSANAAFLSSSNTEISSRSDPSFGDCSLPRSTSDAALTASAVGASSKSGGRKKQRKQAKKSLNYSDPVQCQNLSSHPVSTLVASTGRLPTHDSGRANSESHASLVVTSSCVQSVPSPIPTVLPLVKESTRTSKGTKRSRSKVAQLPPSCSEDRVAKMDDIKSLVEQSKSTSLTSFSTPEDTEKKQSSSRRTRSQSKSQELRDHQTIGDAITCVEIINDVTSSMTSTNASQNNGICSPPSKRRPNKPNPPVTSALKVPLKVPSPMMAAANRQLVISVEKLNDNLMGESASHLTGGLSSLGTNDGLSLRNVASTSEDNILPATGSETLTAATTEEGTQTLRSELKSMKQERRAKKLQEKKKKLQPKDLDVEKPSSGKNSDILSPPAGTLVDDSVQLDLELFNLVDQVERNMAASTQTEPKSKRAQKSKVPPEVEDHGDAKRPKMEDVGQMSRGKDNSLTMKLKRVDSQSNFIVESPIDLNLGSPVPACSESNSPSQSFPKSNPRQCVASVSQSSNQNSQDVAGDNSFYGSRYLPLVSTSSDSGPCLPNESCHASNKNDAVTQNSISNKPYYVLKQPNLVRSEQIVCEGSDSSAKNSAVTNKDDLTETTDYSSDDKAKGGHAIFQSLAKNLAAPTKQVSSKMSSQMARMRQDQSQSAECTTETEERRNEKRSAKNNLNNNSTNSKKSKNDATGKAASREKSMDEDVRQAAIANNGLQESNQCTNAHNTPSLNCYDLSLNNAKLTSKQGDISPDKQCLGNPEVNSMKPVSQCMGREDSSARPCSQERLSSCALNSKTSENQRKSLPSCRQDKDKKEKDQDLCLNSREQTDCSYQSKPIGGLTHQGDYQTGQVAKQQDGGSCQSNRRRSRNEEEDKRSNSVGYHQAGSSYSSNSTGQSGYPYYKTEQAFAGTHPSYYMNPYFDVLHPSARFNPGLTGLPFEASTSLNFLRDCASVFPAFQSPSASFGSDFSCQRGTNSLSKETVEAGNRRSAESSQSNRNSLESNGRGSHQQQQNQTPSLPSCKSAGSGSSYLDGQHQTHSTDKTSMAKQTSSAKKLSKTPVLNYEAPTMFEHMSPMNPFFGIGGLSPNKGHHPAHLSSTYFPSPSFFPDAARNINKGSATNSRTLHHRSVDEGFNKNSPSASSGLDFSSQDFSAARNSMAHQQGRTNAFIGNSMPAHHHSFGFGGFFHDAHQMASPLGHRGAQASASDYYSSYNQQQAAGSNGLSRNGGISRGPSLHSEMALNHFWGNQQAAFDPRTISHPFSTHTFPM